MNFFSILETGQVKVVQYLLEQNVEAGKKDVYGRTPLEIAKELKRLEIVNLVEKHLQIQK